MPNFILSKKIVGMQQGTIGQLRRGMLLARLIIITAVFDLVLIITNLWLWLSINSAKDFVYCLIGLIGLGLLFGIWILNRKGFVSCAAVSIIILYLARMSIVSEPERFVNSFWTLFFPIIIASFIIKPSSSFFAAGASAILYFLVSVRVSLVETLDIILFKLIILLLLAVLMYIVASHLEHAIETVRLSEIKYRNLFNNLPIGLYRTSPDGQILDVNPAFLEMFGFPDLLALQNINARDLYENPLSRKRHLSAVEKSTTTEMQMRRNDGSTFWVSDHVRPILTSNGKILHYEGSLIDISEQKKAELELEQMAITDPLTGLPNRRYFFSRAEYVFGHITKPSHSLAVLMIDIDHFKRINDRFGHAAGDIVLYRIAQMLQSNLRSNDIAGRYGGEEFSVILVRINRDGICQIADRLCKTIGSNHINIGKDEIIATLSIGIAVLDSTTTSLDILLQRADQAMYSAKQAGRNCWKLWEPSMTIGV
jgi:diguanylate cyclase (GGDEF)-like protein/PAS domain S-box-containing protein